MFLSSMSCRLTQLFSYILLPVLFLLLSFSTFADTNSNSITSVTLQSINSVNLSYQYNQEKLNKLNNQTSDKNQTIEQQIVSTDLAITRARLNAENLRIMLSQTNHDIAYYAQEISHIKNIDNYKTQDYQALKDEYSNLNKLKIIITKNLHVVEELLSKESVRKQSLIDFKSSQISEIEYQKRLIEINKLTQDIKKNQKILLLEKQKYSGNKGKYLDELDIMFIEEQLQLKNQQLAYLTVYNQFYFLSMQRKNINHDIHKISSLSNRFDKLIAQIDMTEQLIATKIDMLRDLHRELISGKKDSEVKLLVNEYLDISKNLTKLKNEINLFKLKLTGKNTRLSYQLHFPITMFELKEFGYSVISIPKLFMEKITQEWNILINKLSHASLILLSLFVIIECAWFVGCVYLWRLLKIARANGIDNNSRFFTKVLYFSSESLVRNSLNLFMLTFIFALLWPYFLLGQSLNSIFILGFIWLGFKIILTMSRFILMENTDSVEGLDVKLYHALRLIIVITGVFAGFSLAAHTLVLPAITVGLLDRMLMLILLIACYPLLKYNEVITKVFTSSLNEGSYLQKVVRLVVILIPLILFSNAVIGVFGYVNLAWYIGRIEAQLIIVTVVLLITRGFLEDLIVYLSEYFIKKIANGWLWAQAILKPLQKVLNTGVWLTLLFFIFHLLGFTSPPMSHKILSLLHQPLFEFGNTFITPVNIMLFVVMYMVVHWAAKWSREFSYRWIYNSVKDSEVRNSLSIFTQYGVIIFGGIIILKTLSIDLTTLGYLATGFFVGIAFGVRDIVSNIVSGLLLLIERPVRKGDQVRINEQEGEVIHIGLRTMTILTGDNQEIIVPNNEAMIKPFVNWTRSDTIVRCTFEIRIAFHDNPDWVQKIISESIVKHQQVLESPVPYVLLTDLGESYLLFTCYYFVDLKKIEKRIRVKSEVMINVLADLKKAGINIPYPHHAIQFEN